MDKTASARSGHSLPPSLWADTAPAFPAQPALSGAARCDVAIIGGGFTGLRCALALAEAGVSVRVLEARDIGYGASGRSGGQVNPILRKTVEAVRLEVGPRIGDTLVRLTLSSATDLFRDIEHYGIDCDPVQKGWLQVAHSPAMLHKLQGLRDSWTAAGGDIAQLDAAEVQDWSGAQGYVGGLYHPTAGHVQPLSLVRGLARAALARGAVIHERSPITTLDRAEGGRWHLATATGGQLSAERVVLATNGYTDRLWPGLRATILPFVSIQAATEPLTPAQRAAILPRGTTIADTRRSIIYGRYDRDFRLSIGCMGSFPENPEALGAFGRLRRGVERTFPALRGIAWERKWGGYIALTTDALPHLHDPAPGLYIGLGFNGRGVAMASVMGRALAAALLGVDRADLPFPVTPLKAVPLHRLLNAILPAAPPLMALADRLDNWRG